MIINEQSLVLNEKDFWKLYSLKIYCIQISIKFVSMIRGKLLLVILIVAILCLDFVVCPRGGGSRGGGGSRSRSRSRSSRSSFGSSSKGGNWTHNADGTLKEPMTFWEKVTLGGIISTIVGVICCAGHSQNKNKLTSFKPKKDEAFNRKLLDFQGSAETNLCTLDETQKNNALDWFMGQNWVEQYRLANGSSSGKCNITVKDLNKKSEYVYEIKMKGHQSDIGGSNIQGLLTFQKDYISLLFKKEYNNKQLAGQTGSFDLLVYECNQQGEEFRGKWYYSGYESSGEYSGSWRMIH